MLCIHHTAVSSPAAKQSHPGSTHLKDVVPPIVEALGSWTHSLFLMLAIQTATQERSLLVGRAGKGTRKKERYCRKRMWFLLDSEWYLTPKHHFSETKTTNPWRLSLPPAEEISTPMTRTGIDASLEWGNAQLVQVIWTGHHLEAHCLFLIIQSL